MGETISTLHPLHINIQSTSNISPSQRHIYGVSTLWSKSRHPPPSLPFLRHLSFGYLFNREVDNLSFPLQSLTFGTTFNQSVDYLPTSLLQIRFGGYFNQPVDHLPPSLTKLNFGIHFNQPVDYLPSSLLKLLLIRDFQPGN